MTHQQFYSNTDIIKMASDKDHVDRHQQSNSRSNHNLKTYETINYRP